MQALDGNSGVRVERACGAGVDKKFQPAQKSNIFASSPVNKTAFPIGGLTQNPVTSYKPAYGQRQSSHMLRWPYPTEFSRFRTAYLKLVYVSRIAVVVGDGVLAACMKTDVGHKPVSKP